MKLLLAIANKMIVLILLAAFCSAARAQDAQSAKLQIDHLNRLAEKAEQVIEVTLDERLLQLAARFLSNNNPTEAKVKEIVAGLKGVYVRVFEFSKPGEYSLSDIETIRSQLRQPGWRKIVGVFSRRGGDNVDVHLKLQGEDIVGLAIIAADPTELTVVNVIGPIDLEKLRQLEGQLGIPKLDLEKGGKGKTRN
jgi:hypothetical protein